mmetsp:Transcript_110697/g.202765  ORF Transcript_110697/g.202765 Transcript_110697/m.202765 type:complete len:237 (-) Transcript_110697:531-1241(-)
MSMIQNLRCCRCLIIRPPRRTQARSQLMRNTCRRSSYLMQSMRPRQLICRMRSSRIRILRRHTLSSKRGPRRKRRLRRLPRRQCKSASTSRWTPKTSSWQKNATCERRRKRISAMRSRWRRRSSSSIEKRRSKRRRRQQKKASTRTRRRPGRRTRRRSRHQRRTPACWRSSLMSTRNRRLTSRCQHCKSPTLKKSGSEPGMRIGLTFLNFTRMAFSRDTMPMMRAFGIWTRTISWS